MRRLFFLRCPLALFVLEFFEASQQRLYAFAQRIDLFLLAIDHIAQFAVGRFQKSDFYFEPFERLVHGETLLTCVQAGNARGYDGRIQQCLPLNGQHLPLPQPVLLGRPEE
jgi:hypothetical protein